MPKTKTEKPKTPIKKYTNNKAGVLILGGRRYRKGDVVKCATEVADKLAFLSEYVPPPPTPEPSDDKG